MIFFCVNSYYIAEVKEFEKIILKYIYKKIYTILFLIYIENIFKLVN